MNARVFNIGDVTIPGDHPHISSFVKLDLPVTTALVGAYVFGGNAAMSARNRANPAVPMFPVGSPTIDPLFCATLQHANCFDTGLTPSFNRTWIAVVKPQNLSGSTAADRAPIIGNQVYVSTNLRGDQMYMAAGAFNNQADRNAATAANVGQVVSVLNSSKWAALVGIVDADAGILDCCRRQDGVRTWVSPTGTISGRALYTDRTLRIGGDGTPPTGMHAAPVQVGMVLVHEAALTRAQVDEQLDYLDSFLSGYFGITDL